MLTQLQWEPLAATMSYCKPARLELMFYKINDGLVVAIHKPLRPKLHPLPTRTANSQTYHIPTSLRHYHLHSFYPRTVRDWNILPEVIVTATSSETFKDSISQLIISWYSTVSVYRESRPYHEEPRLKTCFIHFFLHLIASLFCTVHTNGDVYLVTGCESSTY